MSEMDLKRWVGRFEHTTRVWKKKGLTGESSESQLMNLMRMYRGEQWDEFMRGVPEGDHVVVNKVFETHNTLEAQLMARAPRVQLFAASPANASRVRVAEAAQNYYVRELGMKRQMNRAFSDSLFAGFGVVSHGFTPSEEFESVKRGSARLLESFGMAKPDVPWLRRYPVWDVRIDTTGDSLQPNEAKWFARRSLWNVDDFKSNPGFKRLDKIEPTVSMDLESLRPTSLRVRESEDWNQYVEVWTVFDRMERSWFQWSPGAPETTVRDPDDWPLPWDELPYDLCFFNEQMDDPFPVPYMAQVAPIQIEKNKLRTIMSQLVKRLRRVSFIDAERLDEHDRSKLFDGFGPDLAEFIAVHNINPNEIIANVQIGGFPADLVPYDVMLDENIREVTGQSKMDRAQRINVETAQEAAQVQDGSNIQRGRNQSRVEDFWTGAIRKFGQGMRETVDREMIIPIVGIEDAMTLAEVTDGAEPFLRASPADIRADYLYSIRVGSTMPKSKQEEIREKVAWLDIATKYPQNANIPQALLDAAVAFGRDPAKSLLNEEQRRAMQENLESQPPVEQGENLSPLTALAGGQR